ncbi:T9SS type A sorting domain-containing protein, partial [candidate division WOR-3 bacterium]|nr:T9SS type A sorting domain-containing protein [candidate division WOR-3 bacterium]
MKNPKKLILSGTVIFLFSANLFAQAPDTLWTKTYGGVDYDYGLSVQQTADSGYIIAGMTTSFGAGYFDLYLVKTDAQGDTLWTKTYGDENDDWASSIRQTSDGGYIITGTTVSFGTGSPDVWLIKTDFHGDSLWARTFGGSSFDASYSVQQTIDGGYIVAGFTESFGRPDRDVYLIKTDAFGNDIWTKTFGGNGIDHSYSVDQTSDSGYVVAGYTTSSGSGDYDVYLLRTNIDGDSLWARTYGGTNYDEAYSVKQTSDGGYIIAGYTESFGAGNGDIYLIKTDVVGDTVWVRTYGGGEQDGSFSVQQTSDGGYVVAGGTCSYSSGMSDIYIIKTDSEGNTLWTKTIGGKNEDWGFSVQQTSDDGYIIAGWTNSFGAGLNDVYLIKTEPDVGVEEDKKDQRPKTTDIRLFCCPNPFTTEVSIKCSGISERQKVNIEIYDVSGRLVKSVPLTTNNLSLGTAVSWDGRD